MDLWHEVTVAVLAFALFCELLGAYCAQKARFEQRSARVPIKNWRYRWALPWLTYPEAAMRENLISSELGPVARGAGRLAVATLFLIRFACGLPPPWAGWA